MIEDFNNLKKLAPLILFIYNRPVHTEKVLNALNSNVNADHSTLYIFSDGPKQNCSHQDIENIRKTREIAKSVKWCNEVIIYESLTNKGLANSIIEGVTEVINKYGKAIILEDDIVPSHFFIQYMNQALDTYEHEMDVISIGGFNFFANDSSIPETFFIPIPDCWGWATWKNRWDLFEPDGKSLLNALKCKNLLEDFNLHGAYNFEQMLIDQINGKNNSWAIRWQAVAYLHNKLSLYPKYSVTKNIGFDEDATHGSAHNFNKTSVLADSPIKIIKQIVQTNADILKKMKIRYINMAPHSESKVLRIIKKFIKYSVPPVFLIVYKKILNKNTINQLNNESIWSGNFPDWISASEATEGYQASQILAKVKDSVLKVKNGEAVYERDSVIFNEIQYSWALLAILLKIAIENNNKLSIIDFGGSLGTSYFQNKHFLTDLEELKWSVVEQEHFVKTGSDEIADNHLNFYFSIEEAQKVVRHNVLLLSGVIQCLDRPYDWIDKFLNYNFEYIIIDRTTFTTEIKDRLAIQNVPENIYKASYPTWFFNEQKFIEIFESHYDLIARFEPYEGLLINFEPGVNGFILKDLFFKRK